MQEVETKEVNGYMHADVPLTSSQWLSILQDPNTPKSYIDTLLKFYYEPEHEASCKQVGDDYGILSSSVNANVMHFGQYVQQHNEFNIIEDEKKRFYLTIMDGKVDGNFYSYKVKQELCEAVKEWLYIHLEQTYRKYRKNVPIKGEYNGSKWDELYKWELITVCQNRDVIDQAKQWKDTNLYYNVGDRKVVIDLLTNHTDEYRHCLEDLCNEDKTLSKRLAEFRDNINNIVDQSLSSKANDERIASTILTCHNPQKYTFYKSDVYENLCTYLGIKPETRINYKFPHFLELLQPLKDIAAKDEELSKIVAPYIHDQLKSDLLLAQDICWCLFHMSKSYLDLPPKRIEKEKLWIVKVKYEGGKDKYRQLGYIGMGNPAKKIDYANYTKESDLRKDFEGDKYTGKGTSVTHAYWQLMHEVKKGDRIIAIETNHDENNNYYSLLLGWGVLDGECYFVDDDPPIRMKVDWHEPAPDSSIRFDELKNSLFFYKVEDQDTILRIKQLLNIDNSNSNNAMDTDYNKYIELLYTNKNVILTGAPGTGKTYLARHIAAAMIGCKPDELDKSGHFGFVQFHPSYDYTDFVEGLRPVQNDDSDGQIGFERKDGVFKEFCENALKEDKEERPYIFVIDEINRGEISKIFGELFFSIDPGYRGKEGAVRTQYANLQTTPNAFDAVLNSDTYGHFFVPDNVYIIGTMNDIDRSVESMDFAMRRRFAWEEVTAEESMAMLNSNNNQLENVDADTINELKNRMKNLNDAIIGKYHKDSNVAKSMRLSTAYQIGGSYFLKLGKYYKNGKTYAFEKLWDNHIKNVVSEYLRGNTNFNEQLSYLESAYNDGTAHENEDVDNTQND